MGLKFKNQYAKKIVDVLENYMKYTTPEIREWDGLLIIKLTNSGYGIEKLYTEDYLIDVTYKVLDREINKLVKELWECIAKA